MWDLERARRVVAAAYARKYADALTLELMEPLERENAVLRASIARFSGQHSTRSRRYVLGQSASLLIVSTALLLGVYWYRCTSEGSAFQDGFAAGMRATLVTTSV